MLIPPRINLWVVVLSIALLFFHLPIVRAEQPLRIAVGDVPGIDIFIFLVAIERVKDRGTLIDVEYFHSEDIAYQAVIRGDADIGIGTPYGFIQKGGTIRMFYQLSKLQFFPIVNTDYYQTWKDLNGADIYSHAPGSGTEAIMNLMAKKNKIQYKSMNYKAGSGFRAQAMLHTQIKASIVDKERSELLLKEGENRFAILPLPEFKASDETLYAKLDFLKKNNETINILIEELLIVWRRVNLDHNYIAEAQKKYNLLSEIWKNKKNEAMSYYESIVSSNGFPINGGGEDVVQADFEFYSLAGTLKGDTKQLQINDFWYLDPLNTTLRKLGRSK